MGCKNHEIAIKSTQKPPVATRENESMRKTMEVNKGAWTAEEDRKLAEVIAIHGPKRWKSIAGKAGLHRCGKSCRLRWMNYLRPNIKRGNISDQEEDLILRLHKLLGNRWSLIAGRLPGRTDNEIKNYWNSHLSKKIEQQQKKKKSEAEAPKPQNKQMKMAAEKAREDEVSNNSSADDESNFSFDVDQFFDFSNGNYSLDLEWVTKFLELDEKV